MPPKRKYIYEGPVMIFGQCVANKWRGETYAESEKKAKSNLVYQFKSQNNLIPSTKVTLPADVRVQSWRDIA